jgi:hypothetical protein
MLSRSRCRSCSIAENEEAVTSAWSVVTTKKAVERLIERALTENPSIDRVGARRMALIPARRNVDQP